MTSPSDAFSPQLDVALDKLHLLQAASESESSTYRVPRAMSMSIASDQCCTCTVHPVLEHSVDSVVVDGNDTAQISAFVPTSNPQCVHLHCEGVPAQQFLFRDDTILSIKLLPLPGKEDTPATGYSRVVGVVLIVASLKKGLSIFSTVLDKPDGSESFKPVECREFRARSPLGENRWQGRRIRTMTALAIESDGQFSRPFLMVATSSSSESPGMTPADQRVDIQKSMLRDHKCPIFHFATDSTEDLSPSHDGVVVEDVGRVNDMTFGAFSASGFICLAIVTSTQLTLAKVSVSTNGLGVLQAANLLINGCHATHRLGSASKVVSLGREERDTESFAVVCRPKNSDVSYSSPVQNSNVVASRPDLFIQETAIATYGNSVFSPNLTNRKIPNTLIEDTEEATIKELRKTHLDEAVRAEVEATKVVTPEMAKTKKLIEVTSEENIGSQGEIEDVSVSTLSPLLGLTLSGGEAPSSESTLMDGLLSIERKTPKVSRLASPDHMYPNHTAHMILARVEHGEGELKVTPAAIPFPYQMARLEIITLQPLAGCPDGPQCTLSAHACLSFDDLMFSPSPGKLMSPAVGRNATGEGPRFSIVCKTPESQQLCFFLVSASDGKKMSVESETRIDLERILAQSLDVPIKTFSIKGITIEKKSAQRRAEWSSRVRLVLSLDANTEGDSSSSSKPINLSLEEDGAVFILMLSCTMPLASDQLSLIQRSRETPNTGNESDSHEQYSAVEGALRAILERLTAFEKNVASRMDDIENAIRENSDRVGALEAALSKAT